jgi:hypothetical protein
VRKWWWVVIPVGLTVWALAGTVQGFQSLVRQYIGKAFDRGFYAVAGGMLRQCLIYLYAIVASTIALAQRKV